MIGFHHTYLTAIKQIRSIRLFLIRKLSHGSSSISDNDIPNSSQKLNFVLFADNTNMLYADRHFNSLKETVNKS